MEFVEDGIFLQGILEIPLLLNIIRKFIKNLLYTY